MFSGRVRAGLGDAARWLSRFNDAYARKIGSAVFPGSLNLALDVAFDWFEPRWQGSIVWFRREEYGGERDVLLLPCVLENLRSQRAFLWSTTTAARSPEDRMQIEIIARIGLRATYGLRDGDLVRVELTLRDHTG